MLGEKRGIPTLPIIILIVISMAGIGTAHYILFGESVEVGLKTGNKAPKFTTTTLDGENISLKDYRGKIVILDFMATYCPYCVDEIGHLSSIYQQYDNEKLTIISVNVGSKEIGKLKEFRKNNDINWIFVKDVNLGITYNVEEIPKLFIIDEEGIIYYKGHFTTYNTLKNKIDNLLS